MCGLLSVSIVLFSMLGSWAVQTGAVSREDFAPIKWAVIVTGGFDYYRSSSYWSYNTIQRLENYMQGRGVPYDLIRDSDLESARDTPSPGKYPLQFANGTLRYQVLVLQTNSYSSLGVANKDTILQAISSGANAVLFGKALKVFPELFYLKTAEVLTQDWPTSTTLSVNVTNTFDDGIEAYIEGTKVTMGAQTSRVECTTFNSSGKTVWFCIERAGGWSIGMMNSTYGSGRTWFNIYDMSEPALEYSATLKLQWTDNKMEFWAHSINFVLNSAEEISVHLMPFKRWKGAWILRTDRDTQSWKIPPPEQVFAAGWKWLEAFAALGYGRYPNYAVTLHEGFPSGYVGIPSEKVRWADLVGVPQNDISRSSVTYKMVIYSSQLGGEYDRIRIDFNKNKDFSVDTEYKVWEDITYPDVLGTLFWCYISPNFTDPTSIGVGWKQSPMLFDGSSLEALKSRGATYGNLYTLHSFYHFDVGYNYKDAGFRSWNGTDFVQDMTYVRGQFEKARSMMIQNFSNSGYGFESEKVVLTYSGNIFPLWVREVVGEMPWVLYEIGGSYGPGGFYKASEKTKWMLPCYGPEEYQKYWKTYVEAIQTIYPFVAAFQHDDEYDLNFNETNMRPYTKDIKIADAVEVYDFFLNSRAMLQNIKSAFYRNGQVVLEFSASPALVDFVWVFPSKINGKEVTGFSDSGNGGNLKLNDGQNVFIEFSQGQGQQRLEVNYGPPPKTVKVVISEVSPIGSGVIEPVAGQYDVAENSNFQVSAAASYGYSFDHWELDGINVGSANPCSFNVGTTNHTISPIFVAIPNVTVTVSEVSPTGSGTVSPAVGQYQVIANATFQVSATASYGYAFDHWELDGADVGSSNPYSFVVGTADHAIAPFFVAIPMVNIVVSEVSPPGSGTTNPVAGQYEVVENSTFQVSATPSPEYTFDHWELDGINVGSANPCSFNVGTTNHTISPIFSRVVSIQIESCDSLTSWWFRYASANVDNLDSIDGTGSVVTTTAGSPLAWNIYAVLEKRMNFSSYSKLEVWIKASDSTKQLRLMVATDWNNYNLYTLTGLNSNSWSKITIDLSTPTSRTGAINFNSISFIRFEYENKRTAVLFKIDDIRGIVR